VLVTLGMSFIISERVPHAVGGDPIPVPDAAELAIADPGIWLRVSNFRLVLVGCAIGAGSRCISCWNGPASAP